MSRRLRFHVPPGRNLTVIATKYEALTRSNGQIRLAAEYLDPCFGMEAAGPLGFEG